MNVYGLFELPKLGSQEALITLCSELGIIPKSGANGRKYVFQDDLKLLEKSLIGSRETAKDNTL
ncbi:hypothetical protein [Oceanispirochaeta sp.]|jgi:hypothetical protein|uniref:hypothetical protein n=1 Tax=Oceanispirochaeta sp. TaxID=2035350 RepID=UPI00261C061C|nr:hypothetical protein [Oceanispirochaeta sp.]MDA3957201.1 hypothetical protein [Oceanispirochaeta sp.]